MSPEVLGYDRNLAVIEELTAARAGEMEGLVGEMEDFRNRSHRLQSELDEYGVERSQLQHRLDEAEALQHATAVELEALEASAESLRTQLSEAQARASSENERADDAERLQKVYLESLQETTEKAAYLESELASLTNLAAAADAVASSQADNMKEATEQLTAFSENLENANSRAEGLEMEICLLESKLADADSAVLHHRQELLRAGDRLEELKGEKEDLEKRVGALQEEVDEERRRALGLEVRLEEMHGVAAQLQEELEEAHAAAAAEAERAHENCRDLEKHTEQLSSMQSVIQFLEREGKYLRMQIAALKAEKSDRGAGDGSAALEGSNAKETALEQDLAELLLVRDTYEVQLENAIDLAQQHEEDQSAMLRKYDESLRTIESLRLKMEALTSDTERRQSFEAERAKSGTPSEVAHSGDFQTEIRQLKDQLHRATLAAFESSAEAAMAEGASQDACAKLHQLQQKLNVLLGVSGMGHLDGEELGEAVTEYIMGLELRLKTSGRAEVSEKSAQASPAPSTESAAQHNASEFVTDAQVGPDTDSSSAELPVVTEARHLDTDEISAAPPPVRARDVSSEVDAGAATQSASGGNFVSMSPSVSVGTQAGAAANVTLAYTVEAVEDPAGATPEGSSSFLSDATAFGYMTPPAVDMDLGHLSPLKLGVECSSQTMAGATTQSSLESVRTVDAACDAPGLEVHKSDTSVQTDAEPAEEGTLHNTSLAVPAPTGDELPSMLDVANDSGAGGDISTSLLCTEPHIQPSNRGLMGTLDWKAKAAELELQLQAAQETLAEQTGKAAQFLENRVACEESASFDECSSATVTDILEASGMDDLTYAEEEDGDFGLKEDVQFVDAACDAADIGADVTTADAACDAEGVHLVDACCDASFVATTDSGCDAEDLSLAPPGVALVDVGTHAVDFGSTITTTDASCSTDLVMAPSIAPHATNSTQTRLEVADSVAQTRVSVAACGSQTRTEVSACAVQTITEVKHSASATDKKLTCNSSVQTVEQDSGFVAEEQGLNDALPVAFAEDDSDSESSVCSIPDFQKAPEAGAAQASAVELPAHVHHREMLVSRVQEPPAFEIPTFVAPDINYDVTYSNPLATTEAFPAVGPVSSSRERSRSLPGALYEPAPPLSGLAPLETFDKHASDPHARESCLAHVQLLVCSAELERLKAETVHRQCVQAGRLRARPDMRSFMAEIRSVMAA